MNNRQLEIRDFILGLARRNLGITNQQIDSLLNEYLYDNVRSITDIKTEIQTKLFELSSHMEKSDGSLFDLYGITDSRSLLEFIHDNREYGFLDFSNPLITFPLGHLRGEAGKNRIVAFDDRRTVGFLQDYYKTIPEYLKSDPISVSDMLNISTYSRLFNHAKLQSYQDTLKYMVATDIDIIELEASFFEEQGFKVQRYYFSSLQKREGHFFLAYEQDHVWYYFEPLFAPFYGIHEFNSQEELEQVVFSKFLAYDATSTNDTMYLLKDYNEEQKLLYQNYLSYQDRAIYDYRLSMKEIDGSHELLGLRKSSYEKWMKADGILRQLPRTLEFYSLRKVEKPKSNITYREYLRFLYYQTKVKEYDIAFSRYQKENFLLRLLVDGVLQAGTIKEEDGKYLFHGISIPTAFSVADSTRRNQELFSIYKEHLFSLAYVTGEHENRVFYLDSNGDFVEVIGVDIQEVRSGEVQYPFENKDKLYPLQIDRDHVLKFRGAESYLSLRKMKKLYDNLNASEVSSFVPERLITFDEGFLIQNRLPRNREDIYEYARRVGSISRVDATLLQKMHGEYPRGLEFGQLQGKVNHLLTLSHLKNGLIHQNTSRISELFDFTLMILKNKKVDVPNYQAYLFYFAKVLGQNFGKILNLGYYFPANDTIYQISLSGEINHIELLDYKRSLNEVEGNNPDDTLMKELQVNTKYYGSFFLGLPILKVLTDAFQLVSKREMEKPVLSVFLGGYFESLSSSSQDEFFSFYHNVRDDKNLLVSFKKTILSSHPFFLENKELTNYLFSLLDEIAMEKVDIVLESTEIMEDQKFLNQILTMTVEDRFVTYLERQLARLRVPISKLTASMICDNSKIGLLLQKEPLMVHTVSKLLTYQLPNKELFLTVAHDMIAYAECKDEKRKQELAEKLESYTQVTQEHHVVLEIKDETLTVSDMVSKQPQMKEAMGTSGVVTPHYLIFIVCGILFLAVGVVLAMIFG